jgi:adenylate cyclase
MLIQSGLLHSPGVRGERVSFEIERKFLVRGNDWQEQATHHTSIRQAYLAANGKASIRIRIKGGGTATLSVKSRPVDLRRLELEYAIPVLEAEALMQLRQGAIIEKVRYFVPCGDDLTWEVDVFAGENLGLVIAEIELRHVHQSIELPPWIGTEVTGQPQYYNSSLVQRPFCSWLSAAHQLGGSRRQRGPATDIQ